jgi:hypothetical protein
MDFCHPLKSKARLLLLAVSAGVSINTYALEPDKIFERAAPSVWVVKTFDTDGQALATGSAVVIAPGRLVTNCHVLKKAKRVQLEKEGKSTLAALEYPDPDRDLCQIRADGVTALPVVIAPTASLKVGQRVYAIGNPRGLELTLTDGILSALRKDKAGQLDAIQTSTPLSPGSSGGGLFDSEGRLIGITSAGLRDSQNLNFALPAEWIAQLPTRGAAAIAKHGDAQVAMPSTAQIPSNTVAPQPPPVQDASNSRFKPGDQYEYVLTDRYTNNKQTVVFVVDRVDGDRVIFNQGARVERLSGEVIQARGIAGEFDLGMPPGGWVKPGVKIGDRYTLKYRNDAISADFDLEATAVGARVMTIAGVSNPCIEIKFSGYTRRHSGGHVAASAPYTATAWYSTLQNRVVFFEVKAKSSNSVGTGVINLFEAVELTAVRR